MDEIKTLIFRTDRLGDFLISCPFILSYKKNFMMIKLKLFPQNTIRIILVILILLTILYL
jgi:ADP-heptose:LPS heptosyltransferase